MERHLECSNRRRCRPLLDSRDAWPALQHTAHEVQRNHPHIFPRMFDGPNSYRWGLVPEVWWCNMQHTSHLLRGSIRQNRAPQKLGTRRHIAGNASSRWQASPRTPWRRLRSSASPRDILHNSCAQLRFGTRQHCRRARGVRRRPRRTLNHRRIRCRRRNHLLRLCTPRLHNNLRRRLSWY